MKNYFALITLALFYTSCFEDPIELNLNENNTKLVIEAWISDLDEPQYVTISYTANYLGNDDYLYEDNAQVSLSDESGNSYDLVPQGNGKYLLPEFWKPQIGDTYQLNCIVGDQIHKAEHLFRPAPIIENLKLDSVSFDGDSLIRYETVFGFQEIAGLGDAYYIIDYQLGTNFGDSLLNGVYSDDEFFDGEFLDNIRITQGDRQYVLGDTAIVELYSLGKETAQFLMDIELEVFRGGPFDPPPANVRSNFSGGAVGYFIMSGADQKMIVVE